MESNEGLEVQRLDTAAKRIFQLNEADVSVTDEHSEKVSSRPTGSASGGGAISPVLLWKLREWLEQQLLERRGILNADEHEDSETTSGADDTENLEIRAAGLQKQLLEAQTDLSIRTYVLQRIQLGNTLIKTLYPKDDLDDTPNSQSAREKIKELLTKHTALSSAILRINEEIKGSTPSMEQGMQTNHELLKKNRSLMWQIDQAKSTGKGGKGSKNSQVVKTAMWNHEKNVAKVELIRHCLQAVILASGVHWSSDDHLKGLMISLGTPVEQIF